MEPEDGIRKQTLACQTLFNQCVGLLLAEEVDWLENWQGAFNLWTASLKATSIGRSSLDYRVRDHEEVQEVLLGLLEGLSEALECILLAAQSDQAATLEPEGDDDESEMSPSLSESEESEQDSLYGIKKNNSPFFEHMSNIKTIVVQLGRIGTAIRRSGAKYRYRKADASLVEEKFDDFRQYLTVVILSGSISLKPESPVNAAVFQSNIFDPARLTPVQKRLIQANITRRNRIEYATRYMTPVFLPTEEQPPENPNVLREVVAPKMGSAAGRSSVLRKEAGAMTKPVKPKPASTAAPSLSKTATEIGSQFNVSMEMNKRSTPSAITRVTRTGNALDYPTCPKPKSDKDPFVKCPYCANSLTADYSKSHSRWSGHVAQDILPYTCIYEECNTPDAMYLTSSELLQHIRSEHCVTRWVCDHCASRMKQESFVFETQHDWETHIKQNHSGSVTATQLPSLAKASQRKIPAPTSCPLCAYKVETRQPNLDKHIVEHIHQFALECLPWGTGGEDKDSRSAGVPVSRSSLETDAETDLFVDHDFCETENPDDISARFSNMFRFFDESYRFSNTEEYMARLNSTVDRCNQLYDAGDLSPPILETISSKIRKVLLFMRETSWQTSIFPQYQFGDGSSNTLEEMESSSSTHIATIYQEMIEDELDLLDNALSQNEEDSTSKSESPEIVTRDPSSAELPDGPAHMSVELLHLAAARGDLRTVLQLLDEEDIDISAADDDQFTALHFAALCGTYDVVRVLIVHDADLNLLDRYGRTPFHLATRRGSLLISKILLDFGADVNLIDLQHSAPLHLASFHGHEENVELLLNHGADPNIQTDDLWTPLHIAASTGASPIVKLLLNSGAFPSTLNKDSWTALHLAAESSHDDTINLLLEYGASANAVTSDLWTPLHFAVWDRSLRTATLLLRAGANVNVLSDDGIAPIHFAVKNGDYDLVELLLQEGANMNGVGDICSSLLHLAAHFGRLEIVPLLLDHGASPSATNSEGQTPRDLALGQYDDVANLLLIPEVQLQATNDHRRATSEAEGDQSILHPLTDPSTVNLESLESLDDDVGPDRTSDRSHFSPSHDADSTYTTTEHPLISEMSSTDSSKDRPSKQSQITDGSGQKPGGDTMSITDSIADYPIENGRRYHKYHEGAYPYPNDEEELDRLDLQHHMFKIVNNDRLFFAPLKSPKRILDIGTGTGIWPIEMAPLFPDAEITGTDLSPVQPTEVPKNVHFLVEDATEDDWLCNLNHFDYIHISHLTGPPSYKDLMRKAMRHLKPGCYLECHELDFKPKCDDGTMPPTNLDGGFSKFALHDWVELQIRSAFTANPKRQVRVAHRIQRWMGELGFVDVKQHVSKIPLNTWPTDPHLKSIGSWNESNLLEGLSGWSYKPFMELGWSKPEIDGFLVDVRKSIQNRDIHSYMEYYVVTGRKPLPEEQQSPISSSSNDTPADLPTDPVASEQGTSMAPTQL